MSGDSEEKNLPPSQKKLQNLRDRQGQIARSQDVVSVVALIAVLAYIIFLFGPNMDRLKTLFNVTGWGAGGLFQLNLGGVLYASVRLALEIIVPIILIVIVAVVAATGFDGKGFPISAESISPKFNKLNPAEGVKKVFNIRNLVQFIKGLVELSVVVLGNYLIYRYFLNPILWAPSCREECLAKVAIYAILAIIILGLIVLILGAAIDLPISRALFRRENKMSHSEMKREMKEDFGSPEIRAARRERQQQIAQSAGFVGIGKANLLLVAGDYAVGIVYDAETTPAPMIVAKGAGTTALEYQASVREKGAQIMENGPLVKALFEKGIVGEFVPEDYFVDVARALIQAGIIKI